MSVSIEAGHRVVLITNTGHHLGHALALGFAARGWDIAAHFSAADAETETLFMAIRALGRQALALHADLASEAQVTQLVPTCIALLGKPACIINNTACVTHSAPVDTSYDALQTLMATNVGALFVLARALYDVIPADAATHERLRGVVINVLDQKLYNMTPDHLLYPLIKGALQTATVTLAQALAPKVRVTGLAPGFVLPAASEVTTNAASDPLTSDNSSRPDDIVAAACYLAEAASVTGTTLVVDGGQHLIPLPRGAI